MNISIVTSMNVLLTVFLGHEITAAIAQIHLLPSAEKEICSILPDNFKCQLSGIAAWADKIRGLPQFR